MRIWFDMATNKLAPMIDGQCQCQCDSEDASAPIHSMLTDTIQQHHHVLKQPALLHIQECTYEHWLACNPIGSGRLVVLDAAGLSLLQHFRAPHCLTEILPLIPDTAPDDLLKMVTTLYQTGLLQDDNDWPPLSTNTSADTLTAWLHVTNACQLRCHYCYLTKSAESMTEDTALRAVDAIFRSALQGGFTQVKLKYAGGEASLLMNRVMEIHDYALQVASRHSLNLQALLLSNGVALSQRSIDALKARHIGLMISLDGVGETHDRQRPFIHGRPSFKYVDRTIQRLLTNNLTPFISVTISQHNLAGLPDLFLYLLEHDLPFSLNFYQDNDCALDPRALQFSEQQMIDAMLHVFSIIEHHLPARSLLGSLIDHANLQFRHQRPCGVGHNYLVIDQHGGVAKCQAAITQTVTTIANADPLRIIRQDLLGVQGVAVDEKEGCRDCTWRYWCAGGCPLLTHRMTGRYDIQSPNCHIYQALFPAALRLEALRLLKYTEPNPWR